MADPRGHLSCCCVGTCPQRGASAERLDVDGLKVWVTSLVDLIDMKRAAGRRKDRIEVEVLGALRDEGGRRRR
jgi:predicted nucleotidyltransferase